MSRSPLWPLALVAACSCVTPGAGGRSWQVMDGGQDGE